MPALLRAKIVKFTYRFLFSYSRRNKSSLNLWQNDLNTEVKLNIEKHWSNNISSNKYKDDSNISCIYVLPMFPYPSGNLHMGHVRVYSISDTIARFHALNGRNVLHPIGWDAFGLPAENAAIERNVAPHKWTKSNIESMKAQLLNLGINFDWTREISTCDPGYYKWTQYIFLKLYENGLAYQSKGRVNWDPVDKTVLADEQVDELGNSWRSGAKVESKILTQWFIRTTKYAKKLYDGLNSKHLENWKDIINLQKHWIGVCDGVVVTFKIKINDVVKNIEVWCSEPHKFIHGQFLVISKNNLFVEELLDEDHKNIISINPITDSELPVYVSDNVDFPLGRDIYIASPLTNEEDRKIANSLNATFIRNEERLDIENDGQKAIDIAHKKKVGGYYVNSKLKDWLISRQRYWGTPIPIINCPKCGTVPVPYEALPVTLPYIDSSKSEIHTLGKLNEWVNCTCPKCQTKAQRETDTMDTFVDSSWYYYRFLDPTNQNLPFEKKKLINKTPVNIYVGGKEHAVLHLYYARFISYFLHSLGLTPTEEPFKKLLVQGMVMGQSYKLKSSGKYLPPENVEKNGSEYREKNTGEPVLTQWEKMSKSKYNGENPERLLSTYGCDTTRLLILADVPPGTSRRWSDATLPGILNWQNRLWLTMREFLKIRNENSTSTSLLLDEFEKQEAKIWDSRNYFIATATYHFRHTQKLSVGISRLQSLTNTLRNKIPPEIISKSKEFEIALACLIIMLSPVAPHFCSELWAGLQEAPNRICKDTNIINWEKAVLEQKWPEVDNDFNLSFLCKIDGADRCDLKIPAKELNAMTEEKAIEMMMKEESVAKRIKKGISKTKYDFFPGCRAILYMYTDRSTKKAEAENKIKSTTA